MNISTMKRQAWTAAAFLKSLGNEHRLLILCHLAEGEISVGKLEQKLGLRQAHLSQQLARLRRAGLVATRRESRTIFYRLASREAEATLGLVYTLFCKPKASARAKAGKGIAAPARVNGVPPGRRNGRARRKPTMTAARALD